MLESVWVVAFHSIVIVMFTTFSLLFKCFLLYLLIYVALSCRCHRVLLKRTHTHARSHEGSNKHPPCLLSGSQCALCPILTIDRARSHLS